MPVEVATAVLNIIPSMRGLQALIDREMRGVDSRRAGRDAGDGYSSGFGASARKLTGVLAGAFAAVKIGDFAKGAISEASDLVEVSTKLTAIYGEASSEIDAFGALGAKALGMSSLAAKNAAATFGTFGKAAGLAGTENAAFSTELASLAVDMASFSNTTPEEAIEALGSGLRGEAEPLRKYGVLLDDASLRQQALSMGLITTTKEALTPQQKVLASHALIMKQTSDAQGDFARTSGGLANQQRILSAQWTDMKGKLGAAFLPAVNATVTALNDKLFPVLDTLGTKASDAWDVLSTGEFTGGTSLGEEDSPLVSALFGARDAYFTVQGVIKEAWSILSGQGFQGGNGLEEDSPLVDLIFKVREFGLSTFEKLRDIWDTLWSVGEKLWPSLVSIGDSLLAAFQTLSSNGLTVWDLLLDAFQGIADLLEATLVPVFEWLARFMKENPASVLTFVGVILGVVGALKAWAVIQAVLNALLVANPIGLVVVALAALAAAVVWAYNNVDWFREAVDLAWSWIKEATTALWENVLQPIFRWIGETLVETGDFFSDLWVVVSQVWSWIGDKITTVWNWLRDNVFAPLAVALSNAGTFFSDLWNTVSQVWTWINEKITTVWNWLRDSIFAPLGVAITNARAFFDNLWTTVSNVWTWIQDKIGTVWNWLRGNVFVPIGNVLVAMGTFFDSLWTTVRIVWTNIGNFFAGIAQGITTAVANVKQGIEDVKKLITGFGATLGSEGADLGGGNSLNVGLGGPAGGIQNIGKFFGWWSEGGVLSGYAPRRDSRPAMLSPGEGVLIPELVRAVGPDWVYGANRAARSGQEIPHFAAGGVMGSPMGGLGGMVGYDVYLKAMNKIANAVGQKFKDMNPMGGAGLTFNGTLSVGGVTVPLPEGARGKFMEAVASKMGASYVWGAAGPNVFDCSGLMSWALTQAGVGKGRLTAEGFNSSFPHVPAKPGDMATFDTGRLPGRAGHIGAVLDVARGLMMHTDGAGPARVGDYQSRRGLLGFVDPIGGSVTPSRSAQDAAGDPPSSGWLSGLLSKLRPGGTGGGATAASYNPAGGWEQWRSTVLQGLAMIGQPASLVNTVLNQIRTESSGNPRAINLTDSNARRGTPSKGLIQTIDPTFQSYRLPGLANDPYDPLSNIVAGMRYAIDRYGSIAAGMRGVAYDTGGIVPGSPSMGPDSVRAWLTPGEGVFTAPQTDAIITHAKALEAGYSGQLPPMTARIYIGGEVIKEMVRVEIAADWDSAPSEFARVGAQS